MDTEQHRDKVDDPSSSMTLSPQNTDDLQGIYVYQLPFPGTLPEKAQREQLAAVVRKYSKIVEIRFDAVPNNPDMSTVQAGRRFQLPPLSRRALIVFQKISTPSCEALLAELNKQIMSQCHLNASMAKSEHISALIAMRNSSAGHNAAKVHQTISTKNIQQNQPSTTSEQPQQYPSKRPLTLLKIQPPAPAVKAFAMDSQTHTQPDPFHKNASRTLYVKHLDNAITEEELKIRYGKFGHILDIEVKNRNTMAPYAFIQFTNIESVANAIKAFNQQMEECGRQKKNSNLHWWGNTIVTSRLWIGRLPPNCGEQYLMSKMRVVLTQPDDVTQVIYDANFNEAIVMFVGHESTQIAFNKVKNRNITFQPERSSINEPVHHVHVDFCSEKLHDYFIDRLYGKNTEPLLSDVILAPPPDPPKCLSTSQLKKSPSPPPDPSIEGIGSKHSVARPKVLLAESQQQNAPCAIEKTLSANSYNAKTEHPHHSTTTKPSGRTLRDAYSNSMTEEASSHRERPAGKSQDTSERVRSVNVKHTRSNSSSSNTSTDTYSQSPRKRWRHPPQPSELNEFTNSRHKMPKKQSSATKHTWDRKHRSQRSTERRRESRVEKKEKRREKRRSRTRQTAGNVRRTEVERSVGEIVSGGDRSKRGDYGGGAASGSTRGRREVSRVAKYKSRSKERARTKASFSGSCQLLPPPPAPPLRIDKAHEQQKKRRPSSSSDSHSSCTCSSCTSNSSSNSRSSSLSENSDSDFSSTENEAEEERPSTRRSNQSKKDGLTDEPKIANSQPVRQGGTTTVEPVLIHNDPLPLTAPLEVKASGTEHPTKTTGLESEKTIHNESTEENSSSKDKDVQLLQCKDPSVKDDASKKSSTASLAGQQPQPVTKVQAPKTSLRTIVCIPLEALSTPSSDPRLNRLKPSGAVAVSLDLPRFVLKLKMACSSGNRLRADSTNLQEPLLTNTPVSAPPPSADWIKHEPEFNAEIEQKCKIKNAEQNENDSEMEKKSAGPNTLNLLAAITKRIKCVESGITELKISARPEQIKLSNFDQIESEVSRIRTELISGVSMEQLEHSIAQRSPITAQLNTSSTDGGGRPLQPKTIIDGFQTSNLLDFVITKGEDEAEKNSKSEEIEGGLHDRRCSFVSEPDMPTRSFSLSNELNTTAQFDNPSASSNKVRDAETIKFDFPRHTPSAKVLRLAHEKEQLTPSTSSSASPLPKQSVDANSAFSRKPKLLTESSPSHQIRTTVGIPKLKEIKLDRKPSAVSLVTPVDPWATTSTPHGSTRKDKELKSERREYRSDSVGHLPITMAKDRKEGKNETIGGGLKTNHPILKKTPTTTTKSQQKQSREERKTDSAAGCGGYVEQHKKHFKSKAKSVENESTSDVEKEHRKQKRKKRAADQSTSSSSDESVEGLELFNKVDIEEQKRMMKAIKSGVGFGLSMYDRVKRRSSQRPDDDHKKKTALEVLKTKHAKKKKEFSRVRLSSTSTDSDGSEDDAANRKEEDSGRTDLLANNKQQDGNPSSSAEDVEPAVIDDSALSAEKQPNKQQNAVGASAEAKGANTSNLTIRRPEIAPRKPFMEEPKIKEEEEANSSASCIDGSGRSSESESEAGDEEMDAGDRAIKKLKDELSRYRKSSESSVDEAKLFNENLARVVATAAEGCRAQSTASHTENGNSSSESSSSSPSESDTEPITNRLIGNVGMSTKPPSQKGVKHLSMEDVFGADSSEESSDERVPPASKVGLTTAKNKPVVISSSKNDNIKKEVIVPKIKIDQKEAIETSIGKEKMQNRAILAVNKQGKRTRVSSVSSVSSIEHKRFKETKSKISAENEPTSAALRDRSKSDATPLKKAQHQMKPPTTGTSSDVTVLSKEEGACATTEMGKKMKQQTKTIGTKMIPKTSKNAMLMKELAKRKRVKIREEKKLNKSTLKRAIGSDKGQTSKRARTEKLLEQIVDRTEGKDKKKVGKQEELQSVKSAIADTAQCLDVSIATKLAENDESNQRQPPSIVQQEEHSGEVVENLVTVASRKNETDELMDIVAAEKMAESEFEIIDSGNVLTKVAATDKTPGEELKQQKTEEMEVKNKTEEKDGQKKSEEKVGQKKKSEEKEVPKKSEEKDGQKKREEEMDVKNKMEEKDRQKKSEEKELQKKSEEKVGQKKKSEEKVGQKKKSEEKDGQKKGEEATEVREMPAEEYDEEEMEAELLRRMEECNEEEAAVASLRLQSKVDRRNSQDLTQKSDDIGHILSPNEKHWKTLDMEMEKEEIPTTKDDEEENKEEDKLGGSGERVVEEEREMEGTLHGQHTAVDEPTTDKTTVFKFETIERRASNESVDSHMAGVGNGFVEVDAEHLRQQKRDQDAMERLAEERRKTEETVKRMDETVDAVATNSTVLQQHDIASVPQTSPDLAQQLGSFQPLSRQPNALQTAADAFPQQQAEGDVGDYLFPTTMGMGRAQNQQQCEAVIQTVTANPMSMNIQSQQYLQQQQPIHSLQHHFSLPSASVVEDVLSVSSGEAVCKTASSSTTTTSSYPFLMPTTSTMSHHQQQQQHQYGQQHKLQHTHHMPQQQQQHYSSLPQQKPPDVCMMESVSMSLPPSMPVGPPSAYDVSTASMVDSSVGGESSLLAQQQSVIQHQESAKNVASYQQQLQSLAANSTVYTHQISSGMSDVVHQQGMANVFEGLTQDKSHLQQKQKQQSIAPMMLQQRKPSDVKQQQLQHQPAPIVGHNVQQSPLVQPHQGLTDRRLDVQTQQLQLKQPQQQQFRLEQMQLQQQQSRLDPLQQQQSRLEQLQHHQQPRLEQMQPQQPRLEQMQLQQQQSRLDSPQQQQSRLEQMQPQLQPQQQQSRLDQMQPQLQPQQQQTRLDPPQQQQSRLDQIQPQQRQQFQMQHIVQAPSAVQKQQQLQQQQQQYQQKQHQLSSNALTPVLSTQQVQQTKQQNVVQRQRRQQQMPTIPTQQQQQKQLAVSGQYHHQQQQQQHHHISQQQHYQQQPDTLSTMATTGLIDPQLVSLYQHLRDQQMIQQEISKIGQAQQMPSISAAMLAAASATNQITPATLSQWHSIVTPTSTMAHGGALEELLRHGLLAPQTPSMVSPSGRTESAGTSAMAVPSSFDELFHQKLSGSSPSPRGLLQQHQQMSSNVPQLNATHMAQQQQQVQQQQMQQNLLAAGGSVQNKQIQPIQQQQQPPGQQQQQPSIMCHSQSVEKRQQQHVHANVSLQSPPQHVFPSVEQQQQQHIVQQNQQKMVKKQSSANKYPVLWQGQLAMKNADTLVQMHKVCGNEALIQQMNGELSALNENGIPLLRINQRMRLEQTHLENLIRKMEREENQLALICLPCGRDREDVVIQTQKMSVAFIEYFSSKSAAGIVSSGATQQPSAMVAHIFPPSDFSRMLLSRNAPDLLRTVESLNAGYLFVILTNK